MAPQFSGQSSANGSAVLVVIDDHILSELIRSALDLNGYNVHVARDATQAVRAYKQDVPSVILVDLNLSQSNALELMRQMRRRVQDDKKPIVGLIMPGEADLREKCHELGITHFVYEPFDPDVLTAEIASITEVN